MTSLTAPTAQPAPIQIGHRRVVPLVEAVGPALPARATYPQLDADELAALLDGAGDTHADPSRSHLRMASQGFAILGAGRVILVDTCLGGPKPTRPHPRAGLASRWMHTFSTAGIPPTDVDTVINTHLHHDHVGWNTTLTDGDLRPTFPAARYLISRADYSHFTTNTPPTHITDSVLPIQLAGQLDLCEPDTRIDDDIRLVPAPGHTPGHTLVEITSNGQRALLAADLIHHPLQLRRPDISTAMCVDPGQSANTRVAILNEYADTNTLFIASHLPEPGYLHRDDTTFQLTPTPR